MVEIDRILHGELNLPPVDREKWLFELRRIEEKYWFFDSFRNCDLLPLCTEHGAHERVQTNNTGQNDALRWVPFAPLPIQVYFENLIFPWTRPRGRVFAIRTRPFGKQNVHIDCNKDALNVCQLKFRVVVCGSPQDLKFLTHNHQPIYLPKYDRPFVMDGAWPHILENSISEYRYVIAMGSPWQGGGLNENLFLSFTIKPEKLPALLHDYFYA